MIIQSILLDPSGPDEIDGSPNVSRQDPTTAIQADAKHWLVIERSRVYGWRSPAHHSEQTRAVARG
jgi:hypothetical protein